MSNSAVEVRRSGMLVKLAHFGGRRLSVPFIGAALSPTETCELCIGLTLGCVFARSALGHLANPYFFLASVYQYQLVGPEMGLYIAIVLPYLELILAICLIGRAFVSGSLCLSVVLLLAFSLAQYSALSRGLHIGCGCSWVAPDASVDSRSITATLLLAGVALTAYLCRLLNHSPPASEGI